MSMMDAWLMEQKTYSVRLVQHELKIDGCARFLYQTGLNFP